MCNFLNSTIGKKIVVALTGLAMLGFLVGHLMGNLQIFLGPDKFNAYAAFLHHNPGLIWGTRVVMLTSVLFHIVFTVQLTRRNKASRPVAYANHEMMQASPMSRFMIVSGAFLGFYIVYHLLHFTTGTLHPQFVHDDVYANVITGFSVKSAAIVYILAMISLGFHLHHGIWSVFQTLGLNHPNYNCARRLVASAISVGISVGFILIPLAVLMGVLH